jgi:hypothetical protein
MDMPGVLKHPQLTRIVAVADFDSKRAELARRRIEQCYEKSLAQRIEVKTYGDYHELLARKDIDAVMISTPDHWHAQPVVEAALAGKDIYVQKPLSMTIAEGRLVSDVLRAQKRVLQIGSQQRSPRSSIAPANRAQRCHRPDSIHPDRSADRSRRRQRGGNARAGFAEYDAWLGCTPASIPRIGCIRRRMTEEDFGRPDGCG